MTSPIPAAGYPSNTSRTQADMQTYFETMLSTAKEQLGGTGEAASVQLASNTFTPGNNACFCPIDTNAGGPTDTLNTIQTTNIRDGEAIFIRSTNNAHVITVVNAAGGAGEIFTADGNNIVLNSTKLFVALKYNLAITAFEELFRTSATPNLSSPGPIGNTTPNTGEFTTLTLTGSVAAHKWLGNNTSSSAAPSFQSIASGDLPASSVNTVGNLSPIFSAAISAQALNFTLTNANAGTLFGNFGNAVATPTYNAPGSADQVLGVSHTAGGLEYKTIAAGSGITITPTAGTITIAATGGGGFTNPMTTLGDTIYGASSGAATRLAGNTTAAKQFLNQTGTGSASATPVWGALASSDIPWASPGAIGSTTPSSASFTTLALIGNVSANKWLGNNTGSSAAPSFESITSADLPASTVNSAGNLSPLFTTAISSQALNFSLSNAAAGSLLGNASGASAAPSYIAPGSNDELLGVAHTGSGLEYKSLVAGANITITPSAGSITIASTGGGGSTVSLMNQLRLYATSGAPFSNTTYTTASAPVPVSTFYIGGRPDGNLCTFNQGSSYQTYSVSETAFAVSGLTASIRYDLYMKVISGTVTTSTAAWTGTATPPTRGADAYGRATKNGDTTSLLIGTFLANTATTASLFTSVSDTAFYAGTPTGMLCPWQPPTTTTPIPNGFALCNGATAVWETGPSAGTSFTTLNYIGMQLIGSDMPSGTSTANASGFGSTVPGTTYGATTHAHSIAIGVTVYGGANSGPPSQTATNGVGGSYNAAGSSHYHTVSMTSTGSATGSSAAATYLPSCIGAVMLVKL